MKSAHLFVFFSLIASFISDRNLASIGGFGYVSDVNGRVHRLMRRGFDLRIVIRNCGSGFMMKELYPIAFLVALGFGDV
jgi:hypothetical protein